MATELKIPNTSSFLLQDGENTVTKIRLNPSSFTVLKEAVTEGMQLAATRDEFERRYDRNIIQMFLERDPNVYDYVLQVFITTHMTCERFAEVANHEMPDIGRLLVRVADSAMELLGARLNSLAEKQNQNNTRDMLNELSHKLHELSASASDLSEKSEIMQKHIIEFKADSKKNYEDAAKASEHWEKAKISDEEWQARIQQRAKSLEEMMNHLKEEADKFDAQARFAPSQSHWAWGLIDTIGSMSSSRNVIRSREQLQDSLKQIQREMEKIEMQGDQDKQRFREASDGIKMLQNTMHHLKGHSEEVAAAIADVNFAASRLVTDNEYLADQLEYLRSDVEMDAELEMRLQDTLNSREDQIAECLAMWKEVRGAGAKFAGN